MQLPVILPEIKSQRFDCRGCAKCCRDLVVQLTRRDRDEIDRQAWRAKLGAAPYVRLGGNYVLNHGADGGCVFLTEDGRCRIHAEFGMHAKPLVCQLFPFTLRSDPHGLRAGLRFDCPTVAANAGSPLAKHRRSVSRLAEALARAIPGEYVQSEEGLEWVRGRVVSSETADHLVAGLDGWIRSTKYSLQQRIEGLIEIVDKLGNARLRRFDDQRLNELVSLLMSDLPNVVEAAAASDVAPPTRRQLKLLSQAVFAHCEHVSFHEARRSRLWAIRCRWDQLSRARRLAAQKGVLPRLGTLRVDARFSDLRAVVPAADLAVEPVDRLLTRYLQGRITCRTAFGRAYYGWPVLDGLQALLLAIAVIGWLTRFVALVHGRSEYRFEDLAEALGLVDRSAGPAGELGRRSARLRGRYLSENQGLLRLLRAYPILG